MKLTIYTNHFLPEWVGARAIMFLVLIRPKYRDDKGIHAHEYTHVRQWYKWTGLALLMFLIAGLSIPDYWQNIASASVLSTAVFAILYKFSTSFRLEAEAEAYAAQVKAGADLDKMAKHLANPNYNLGISELEARLKIQRYL